MDVNTWRDYTMRTNTRAYKERTPKAITRFSGRTRFLSSFWLVEVEYGMISYPSVEHAYQAAKEPDEYKRELFVSRTHNMRPGEVKECGNLIRLRLDWDVVRIPIMTDLVDQKFNDKMLAMWLEATGDRILIEGNTWGDTFWGECPLGTGENNLGIILMDKRESNREKG